ncbi:ribbon-helix-helix protein, CopG family [uncultured Corynebacterium sp.]|uniref:type II toxin-antitoxin system RelB family antitoxin n=1 Tax=uncultured Corynebacterium sp. TaxID=159447 RepID=UPI00262C2C28|nr:ribbon-helix-helix protein, CopG family [uncultured Corynebacterium sp.]
MTGSVISLRVDKQQKERLDALVSKTGRTSAYYVREALDAYLDKLEYIYTLEEEAEAARRGEIETISLEELEAECGLVD